MEIVRRSVTVVVAIGIIASAFFLGRFYPAEPANSELEVAVAENKTALLKLLQEKQAADLLADSTFDQFVEKRELAETKLREEQSKAMSALMLSIQAEYKQALSALGEARNNFDSQRNSLERTVLALTEANTGHSSSIDVIKSDIADLSDKLEAYHSLGQSQIATNTSAIANHQSLISTTQSNVDDNRRQVSANKAGISSGRKKIERIESSLDEVKAIVSFEQLEFLLSQLEELRIRIEELEAIQETSVSHSPKQGDGP